jgi:hypothetical protein
MLRNLRTGDPLIDDVQRVKREISAEFDHDPAKLVAFLYRVPEAVRGSAGGVSTQEHHRDIRNLIRRS